MLMTAKRLRPALFLNANFVALINVAIKVESGFCEHCFKKASVLFMAVLMMNV